MLAMTMQCHVALLKERVSQWVDDHQGDDGSKEKDDQHGDDHPPPPHDGWIPWEGRCGGAAGGDRRDGSREEGMFGREREFNTGKGSDDGGAVGNYGFDGLQVLASGGMMMMTMMMMMMIMMAYRCWPVGKGEAQGLRSEGNQGRTRETEIAP